VPERKRDKRRIDKKKKNKKKKKEKVKEREKEKKRNLGMTWECKHQSV